MTKDDGLYGAEEIKRGSDEYFIQLDSPINSECSEEENKGPPDQISRVASFKVCHDTADNQPIDFSFRQETFSSSFFSIDGNKNQKDASFENLENMSLLNVFP